MAKLPIEITGNNRNFIAKLNEVKQKIQKTFQGASIGGMGTFLSASVWGAAATATYKVGQAISETIKEFRELRSEARAIGTTTAEMSRLSDMAAFSGTKLSDMTSILGRLRDLQIQAAIGSVQAATALAAVGLSAEKVARMSPAEQLRAVSQALDAIPDKAQRAAVSLALFGKMPEEIDAMATAFEGLQDEAASKNLEQASKGWDLITGAIKQAAKEALAYTETMRTLRGYGYLADLIEAANAEKAGKATPDQAAAVEKVAKGFAGVTPIAQQHLPVDEFRRIGGFEDSMRLDAIAPAEKHAEEQVQVSKEILDHVMKVYEAMKSMDEKTPALGGKF